MKIDKVSIYIPVYNSEKTIEFTINSVLNQSHKFDEIIIIDDFSKDNTLNIVNQFNGIKLIKNSSNRGLGYCRNLGIKNSSNQIIASIDSDVELHEEWLKVMLEKFNINPNIICGGNMEEKFLTNKFNFWRAKYYSQNWGNNDIVNPPFLYGCNTIQNKNIWKEIGGYDETFNTNGEDIDYSKKIHLAKKFKLIYCSKANCKHLQNDNLNSLAYRVWRYHSFGYKIKKRSINRFFKLSIKQIKFFIKRSMSDILKLKFNLLYLNFMIMIKFIILEFKNIDKKI